jgi:hypothetical protein
MKMIIKKLFNFPKNKSKVFDHSEYLALAETPPANISRTIQQETFNLYESRDGKFRGSLEECRDYENSIALRSGLTETSIGETVRCHEQASTTRVIGAHAVNELPCAFVPIVNNGILTTSDENNRGGIRSSVGRTSSERATYDLFESFDGLFRGTFEECVSYQNRARSFCDQRLR